MRLSQRKTSAQQTTNGEKKQPGSRVRFVPGLVGAGIEAALLARRLGRRGLTLFACGPLPHVPEGLLRFYPPSDPLTSRMHAGVLFFGELTAVETG